VVWEVQGGLPPTPVPLLRMAGTPHVHAGASCSCCCQRCRGATVQQGLLLHARYVLIQAPSQFLHDCICQGHC
jgi:hypothetical protein